MRILVKLGGTLLDDEASRARLAAELAERGQIDRSAVADHPRSNVLLRALGLYDSVEVDMFRWSLQAGDRLLLCSDGLVDMVLV